MALTQKDFIQIRLIVENGLETKLDEKLEEKLRNLPTKDEFFSKMDEVMGELKTIREEVEMVAHRSSNHEDRIVILEEIHPGGKHAVTQ